MTSRNLQKICELISSPEAPYAHTIHAEPGDTYESQGPPFPSLTVVESVTSPITELLYHRQTVSADLHPGEPPEMISVNRMVGVLEDGSEVPMGEAWALPASLLDAVNNTQQATCAACGIPIKEIPVLGDGGKLYHAGCLG